MSDDLRMYSVSSSSIHALYNNGLSGTTNYAAVTLSHGGSNFENGGEEHLFNIELDVDANQIWGDQINGLPLVNSGIGNGEEITSRIFKKNGNNFITLKENNNTYKTDDRLFDEVFSTVAVKSYVSLITYPTSCTCTEKEINEPPTSYYIGCKTRHFGGTNDDPNHFWGIVSEPSNFQYQQPVNDIIDASIYAYNYATSLEPVYKCLWPDADNQFIPVYHPCHGHNVGDVIYYPQGTDNINLAQYSYRSYWRYLSQTVETTFDQNGQNPISKTTNFYYDNPKHLQLTRTETFNTDGTKYITRLKYPGDYVVDKPSDNDAKVLDDMANRIIHMGGLVIEKTSSIVKPGTTTELITGAELTKYEFVNNKGYLAVKHSRKLPLSEQNAALKQQCAKVSKLNGKSRMLK